MKCTKCGEELLPSQRDAGLCHACDPREPRTAKPPINGQEYPLGEEPAAPPMALGDALGMVISASIQRELGAPDAPRPFASGYQIDIGLPGFVLVVAGRPDLTAAIVAMVRAAGVETKSLALPKPSVVTQPGPGMSA